MNFISYYTAIVNICLIITFVCIWFNLLNKRIKVSPWAKAWSCFILLGAVATWTAPKFVPFSNAVIWVGVAGFALYTSVKASKRGYV